MVPDAISAMFTPAGRPSPHQIKRWRAKGGLKPLMPLAVYIDEGGMALPVYRSLWARAFPTKRPMPQGPVATRSKRFTADMLDVWLD